ncbi:MAG: hypothetical protein JEY99_20880 [Spirochaetales bacterium]|nr:hypothetical protein [Spirochaetales bacterium]
MKKTLLISLMLLLMFSLFSQEKKVITVLDFNINNISENDMKSITSFLSAALFDTGMYQVIDASQRNAILDELSFSASGCVDESCQLEIGKMLSAEMIVVGDIGLLGGRYLMTAKLIETETSNTINTAKGIYADLGELIDGMYVLAESLAGVETLETTVIPPMETSDAQDNEGDFVADVGGVETVESSPDLLAVPEEEKKGLSSRKIAGLSCLAGGVLASGFGGYLMVDAYSFYSNDLLTAETAYDNVVTDYPGDWSALSYEEREALFDAAYDVLADAKTTKNNKLFLSAGVAGGGLVLIGVGAFLFFSPEKTEVPGDLADFSFNIYPGLGYTSFQGTLSF